MQSRSPGTVGLSCVSVADSCGRNGGVDSYGFLFRASGEESASELILAVDGMKFNPM